MCVCCAITTNLEFLMLKKEKRSNLWFFSYFLATRKCERFLSGYYEKDVCGSHLKENRNK